ncbi:MAG: class I tRNA ligase family protein [Desulfomicrobium escambiense]|nr:class I tRNA ligase family protein [Desulfomicrobium escambiense]
MKDSVSWGIPVPNDDSQVIYVWIDALSNYITAIGYGDNQELFNQLWPAEAHMIGKDILKFHSIYWIAVLMALELPLPKTIYAHGWITINQAKMSKSVGNVISPVDILKEYNLPNSDALRYFLMTTTPFGRDGNYSDEDFKNKINADLANNLGNLLNRTLSMLVKYFDGNITPEAITAFEDNELAKSVLLTKQTVIEEFDKYRITDAADAIFNLVDKTNKYVNEEAPWSLAKNPETLTRCAQVLYNTLETLRQVSVMIYPFVPNIAQDIWSQLSLEGNVEDKTLEDIIWGGLKAEKITSSEQIKPVFLRVDSELAGTEKKKQ